LASFSWLNSSMSLCRADSYIVAAASSCIGYLYIVVSFMSTCILHIFHINRDGVSDHPITRDPPITRSFSPCHPDRPRTTLSLPKGSEWEWKDPGDDSHYHAASGSSLETVLTTVSALRGGAGILCLRYLS
jgi:hypothetical protein